MSLLVTTVKGIFLYPFQPSFDSFAQPFDSSKDLAAPTRKSVTMTALKNRPPSGTAPTPRSAGGGTFRTFGQRRMSKLRQRVILIVYPALGCLIPYYLMMNAEQEPVQQELESPQQQDRPLPVFGENVNQEQPNEGSVLVDENNPRGYRRRMFFCDMGDIQLLTPPLQDPPHQQQHNPESRPTGSLLHQTQHHYETDDSPASSDPLSTHIQLFYQRQKSRQKDILGNLTETLALHRRKSRLSSVKSYQKYTSLIQKPNRTHAIWLTPGSLTNSSLRRVFLALA
jgi:hypothetical protein